MTDAPSPFSSHIPKLQVAWDATSLRSLMTCPRQYQYQILEGWRPQGAKVDLEFGGFFASACEIYKKGRINGKTKEQATLAALRYTIEATWVLRDETNPAHGGKIMGPWGGRYEELWHCTGAEPYRNAKGNKAKCPWSHKGVWLPSPAPDICGECGSEIETQRQWISDNKTKDRYTLVRLVAWYCDEQPETKSDGPWPYQFPNGQPAVELSFQMPLPWKAPAYGMRAGGMVIKPDLGEPYILCGHIDSIMTFGNENFPADNKTTKNALGQSYFAGFSPNIQMDVYDLAGSMLYPSLGLRGVMIEAAQVQQEGARFGVGVSYRTDKLREELLTDLRYWLTQAEKFASDDYWPMNRASCYLCPFKGVCNKDPDMRQGYLEGNFVRDPWNPLKPR